MIPVVCLSIGHKHSQFWPILARFMDYYSPIGVPERFPLLSTPRCTYILVINAHSFGRFWPVSWAITHRFVVPERFLRLMTPVVRLPIGHQPSQFCSILARFMDYYSQFSGPGAISMVFQPKVCLHV